MTAESLPKHNSPRRHERWPAGLDGDGDGRRRLSDEAGTAVIRQRGYRHQPTAPGLESLSHR